MTHHPSESWEALIRRFIAAESGGAGIDYAVFAACWAAVTCVGLYLSSHMLAGKFQTINAALTNPAVYSTAHPYR